VDFFSWFSLNSFEILKLSGAALAGSMLAGIGFLFKRKYENTCVKKRVLFFLLEIWHSVFVFQHLHFSYFFDVLSEALSTKMDTIFGTEVDESEQLEIKIQLTAIVTPLFESLYGFEISDLEPKFKNAIIELAPINPFIAFELSSNTRLKHMLSTIEQTLQNHIIQSDECKDPNASKAMFSSKGNLIDLISSEVIDNLELGIRRLSIQTSVITYILMWNKIRKMKKIRSKGISKIDVQKNLEQTMQPLTDYLEEVKRLQDGLPGTNSL